MRDIKRTGAFTAIVFEVALTMNGSIVQHGRCGSSGENVYVKNMLSDKPIKATISTTRQTGSAQQASQRVVRVLPGGEVRLGCSVGSADLKNTFEVISTDP